METVRMALKTASGKPVEIIANCGYVQPGHYSVPVTLIMVRIEGEETFMFAEQLRPDKGWAETRPALNKARKVELELDLLVYGMEVADT
jgi:hypothetical protein